MCVNYVLYIIKLNGYYVCDEEIERGRILTHLALYLLFYRPPLQKQVGQSGGVVCVDAFPPAVIFFIYCILRCRDESAEKAYRTA